MSHQPSLGVVALLMVLVAGPALADTTTRRAAALSLDDGNCSVAQNTGQVAKQDITSTRSLTQRGMMAKKRKTHPE